MPLRHVLGLGLGICLAAPAAAESWFNIATTGSSIDYADADSLRSNGGVVSLEVLRGFGGHEVKPSGYVKLSLDIACYDNHLRVTRSVSYDLAGKRLSSDESPTPWAAFESDTLAEEARRFACDGVRGTPVLDPFADAEDHWYGYDYAA